MDVGAYLIGFGFDVDWCFTCRCTGLGEAFYLFFRRFIEGRTLIGELHTYAPGLLDRLLGRLLALAIGFLDGRYD